MRTYDKLIETISARRGTGDLRPRFGDAVKPGIDAMRGAPCYRKKAA